MRRWGWALAGIVLLGAALRLWQLGDRSLWIDEALTVRHLDGDLGRVLERMREEDAAPLYPLLAWCWSQAFGLSEVALRSLPALLGIATIPVVWAAGARLAGRRAGALAALLAAVSPFLVWHAQDARAYALLILLSAVAFLAFLHVLDGGGGRWAAAWAGASVLAVLTHYDAVFAFVVQAAWLLVAAPRRRLVVAALSGPVLAGVAALPLAIAQAGGSLVGAGVGGEAASPSGEGGADDDTSFLGIGDVESLLRRIAYIGGQFATGYQPRGQRYTVAAAVVLLLVAAVLVVRFAPRAPLRRVAVAAGIGLATIGLAVVLTLAGIDQVLTRFQSPAFVPLVVALGAALALAGRRVALPLAAAAAALGIGVTVATAGDPKFGYQDWRGGLAALGPAQERRLLVLSGPHGHEMLPVYRPGSLTLEDDVPPPAVREVVALALPDDRLRGGRQPEPPRPAAPPPPRGFRLVEHRRAETFTLFRYRARRAVAPDPFELEALRVLRDDRQPPFIVVAPGSGKPAAE